jgi:hypothetical protein
MEGNTGRALHALSSAASSEQTPIRAIGNVHFIGTTFGKSCGKSFIAAKSLSASAAFKPFGWSPVICTSLLISPRTLGAKITMPSSTIAMSLFLCAADKLS